MLLKLTKYDILFQFRHGFYLVYAIVSVVYMLILFNIPMDFRPEVTAYLLLSDTSVLGFTFVGALVLLEKQQNVLQSLFATPLKLSVYLWAKAISMTVIAIIVSAFIGFVPGGLIHNWLLTIVAVLLCSVCFTFAGLGISAQVKSLNGYIMGIMVLGMVIVAPVALYFYWPVVSLVFPINAALDLLIYPPADQTIGRLAISLCSLMIWNGLAFVFASHQFKKHIIQS